MSSHFHPRDRCSRLGAISLTTEVVTPARRVAMISLRIVMLAHKVFLHFSHEFCADCENTSLIKNCHTSLVKSIAVRIHAYAELVALCLHRVPRSNGHVKAHASKQNLYWWTNQNLFWQSAPISALARVRHADQKKQANHHRFPSADWLCRCISKAQVQLLPFSIISRPSFFLLQLFPGQSKTQNDTIHYVHNNAWPTFRNGIRNSTNVTPLALRFGFAPFKVQIWAMKWKKKKPAGLRANLNSDRCRNARWWLPGSVQPRWLTIRVILSGI